MKKMGFLATGAVAMLLMSGCGDEKATTPPPKPEGGVTKPAEGAGDAMAAKPKADLSKFTETVSGTVTFDGDAPTMKKLNISGDAFCEEHNKGDAAAKKEELVVNPENKGVMYAFVYVKSGPVTEFSYDVPAAVTIEQEGCVYRPHVIGVLAKQAVKVGSDDDTKHNVHWVSKLNGDENHSSSKGSYIEITTKRAELGGHFKCDIHSWMQAYVCIATTPFFAVTDKDGKYTLPKLPAGDYKLGIWQEGCAEQELAVKVEAGKAATGDFKLKAK